jgi:hypothetical protein
MTNNLLGLLANELKKPVTMYRMDNLFKGKLDFADCHPSLCARFFSSLAFLRLSLQLTGAKKNAPATYAVLGNPQKICWSEVRGRGSPATPIVWVICSRNCLQKSGLHYQQSLHRYS